MNAALFAASILALNIQVANAVDFTQPILNEDGKPVCQVNRPDGMECPEEKVLTLGGVVRSALYAAYPDEQGLAGEEKYRRAALAQATVGAGDIKVKLEDLALIKKLIGKLYAPLVVFGAWNLLEK